MVYLKHLYDVGGFKVMEVDGDWIRSNLEPDFTNYGQPLRWSFIPPDELWVDKENRPGESGYFVSNMLEQHRQMSLGRSWEDALKSGAEVERKERSKVYRMDQPPKDPHSYELEYLGDGYGAKIYLIDGEKVRTFLDPDFTEGGHDQVYSYVPPKTIWLDNDLPPTEIDPVLVHEGVEREMMANGMTYPDAHREALKIEFKRRNRQR